MLDRPAILPPRWASAGAVRPVPQRARGDARRRGFAFAALVAGIAAMGTKVVLAPSDALGDPRPAAVHVVADGGHLPAPAAAVRAPVGLPDPCPLDWRADRPLVRPLIACEAALWEVPGGAPRALAVAWCESRFQTAALNPTGCGGSGCGGLFQQSLRYWSARAAGYGFGGKPPSDPRANVVVSMRMAVERGTWARDWPVCGR